MLIRAIERTLLRNLQRCYFAEQAHHATAPAYLTPEKIKSTLAQADYNRLVELVKTQEQLELTHHRQRLHKLETQLGEADKARIQKIQSLLASLNEQQAEYVRYRLLAAVENQYSQ